MNHPQAAKVILSAVGGIENIISADHCATRMRFVLRDETLANDGAIKSLEGVLDVVRSGGQYQIVVGPDVVRLYNALLALDGFEVLAKGSGEAQTAPHAAHANAQEPFGPRALLRLATSTLAALFVPIIPALTAAGLLQCIILMLSAVGLLDASGVYYQLFYQIGRAPFYYLPFLLAYTSARRFKVDVSLALLMAGVLMSPSLAQLLPAGARFPRFLNLIPLVCRDYSGSVLPIILIVWLMSYVSRLAEACSPETVKFFSVPLLVVLLGGIPGWLFLAPLGYLAGNLLASGITLLASYANWLPAALIGAFNPLMVMSGTHYPLVALGISNLSTFSYDSIVGPGMLASNLAQGAAALAAALVTRSATVRRQGVGAGITALLGITEPALFGCNLRLRYPLWGALIGGGAGGLFMGIFRVRRYTYGSPGLLVLPGYLGGQDNRNFFFACIGCAIAIIVSFCTTILIAAVREWKTSLSLRGCTVVESPIRGQVVALSHVPDKVFSSGLMGAGCAVMPEDNKVYAPFDGVVRSIAHTGHAIGLSGANGVSLLIHVGINTVYLREPCFRPVVHPDQQVKKGDPLMTFDLQAIQDGGCSPVVPIVMPEFDGTLVCPPEGFMVGPGRPLFGLKGEAR